MIEEITDADGRLRRADLLAQAEGVHRELRPQLPADYAGKMARVFAGGGRMAVAWMDGAVLGVAVWRIVDNTADGLQLYCDDLVTTATRRSQGVGKALLAHMVRVGERAGCDHFALDSGTQRGAAHRFYFREGFEIGAFNFGRALRR